MAKKSATSVTATPQAPDVVRQLVAKFTEHRDTYKRGDYNETQLRRDFLDPFFAAMGWDIDNRKGYAEKYREVIHEDALKVEASVRAPDYCFRIGGQRIFFVEAKKPAVNIKDDIAPAFQLRRYAWTAKLPLSILTDFEELAVYDCRIKPDKNDKASVGRVMLLKYTDYLERWQDLCDIFSYDAIARGAFDKYAESKKKKRGTAEVDEAFLEEIEDWRFTLAKTLGLRNKDLSERELNTAVQLIIDRIIFLRMCEGRGIEPFGRLQGIANGAGIYPRLVELFRRADEKYNSGLFHFLKEPGREQPDVLTTQLVVDDKVLKEIIRRLYYPESPYEFAAMPAEILGQVYEQFLGKVIRLTKSHHAKIEEKPEVRKAGGVYYTPKYIVDYIVENTVGKLLEGKTPQEVGGLTKSWKESKKARPLTVLDPACGSGSFLIVAYQYLLDWYLKQYSEIDKPEKHAKGANPRIYMRKVNDWRLTSSERKRILTSHIYGVDIDYQAVEVTKLSLLLKVLEGETEETLQRQLFAKERALPDLANNIKCGNSLIGPDFYTGRQSELFDEEEALRINAFDWDAEFKEIFSGKNPGFDAVVGNPPYIRMEEFKPIKQYLQTHYECHSERADIYVYFIEKEHRLLKDNGTLGMIVSNKFIRAKYGEPLRGYLQDNSTIKVIADLAGLPVFRGATVRTIVLISEKSHGNGRRRVLYSPPPEATDLSLVESGIGTLGGLFGPIAYSIPSSELRKESWRLIRAECAAFMDSLSRERVTLSDFVGNRICRGIVSGLTEAFVINGGQREQIISRNPEASKIIRPFLQGRQVRRYYIEPGNSFLIYTHHDIDIEPYPAVVEHLQPYRKKLENRATEQAWYELQQPQYAYLQYLERPKIVFPDMATGCRFALDEGGFFGANTMYFLPTADRVLLGLLNSRLAYFFFQQTCAALEGPGESYLRFFGQYLEGFPVCLSKGGSPHERKLANLSQQMLDLNKRLPQIKTGSERTAIERQIAASDREIDQLVYQLYGLTDKEIALVEEATK